MIVALGVTATAAVAIPEGPEYPSAEWTTREAENFLKTREEFNRELTDPEFQLRLTEQSATNAVDYAEFTATHGILSAGNLCATWAFTCAGDPFRYPGTDPFYETEGTVTEVLRFDRDCSRISGRVWKPKDAQAGDDLPGVVITNGSIQAPETLYWWFAQALVRQGYVVMTWDPRGQGRSDTVAPDGTPGTNLEPSVFTDGTVDAIDFFHSTPSEPYPHNPTCAASVTPLFELAAAAPHNPFWDVVDRDRLGLAGHSLGAGAVSTVQAMDPWEGALSSATENPVDVIVAWDSLSSSAEPRVPAMGQTSEYGIVNTPKTEPPVVDGHLGGFAAWTEAGVPVSQFTIRGSTHFEWSLIPGTPVPNFSATSWVDWGRPMAEHYSLAWMDRWLKVEGEPGFDTADARLADDATYCPRYSFYSASARRYPERSGTMIDDADVRATCLAAAAAGEQPSEPTPDEPMPAEPAAPDSTEIAVAPSNAGTTGGRLPATGSALPIAVALAACGVALGARRYAGRRA